MSFGAPHHHYRITTSTNTRARELAAAGAPHGTVVTAEEQTEGRGRGGRSWRAPPGRALLYSAILRPLRPHHLLLSLAVSLAVCEVAEELEAGIRCQVKWPNDVQVEGRKLAGILIEAHRRDSWAVIGVGLNLAIESEDFPRQLRESAVSLSCAVTPAGARAGLNTRLDHWTEAEPDAILNSWRLRDALIGKEVAWDGGSGVADGVDHRGSLLVISGGERLALSAGEIHLLGA
jgi:BirA family transcriptional regulator, biotin operon repressor / biotin---[acetyl-CoA-carboxylase] ligase